MKMNHIYLAEVRLKWPPVGGASSAKRNSKLGREVSVSHNSMFFFSQITGYVETTNIQ